MNLPDTFQTMARYNRWMNGNLYAACEPLPDAERKRDLGAFFRSVHGTLNHLLLADRVWMGRFTGPPFPIQSLDQELFADYGELRRERERTDADIEAYVSTLTPEALDAPLAFTSVSGREFAFTLGHCLLHLFNHQTHHRGQVTALLHQLGGDSGVTDLLLLPGAELRPDPPSASP